MRAQTRKQMTKNEIGPGDQMKRTVQPAKPGTAQAVKESNPLSILSRIKLAFLDEYTCEKRGYDPYDTSRTATPDIWASKRKRA
jgi:hypothetical protein